MSAANMIMSGAVSEAIVSEQLFLNKLLPLSKN